MLSPTLEDVDWYGMFLLFLSSILQVCLPLVLSPSLGPGSTQWNELQDWEGMKNLFADLVRLQQCPVAFYFCPQNLLLGLTFFMNWIGVLLALSLGSRYLQCLSAFLFWESSCSRIFPRSGCFIFSSSPVLSAYLGDLSAKVIFSPPSGTRISQGLLRKPSLTEV